MAHCKERLEAAARVLYVVERRRAMTGEPGAGASIERHVIDRELADLEAEIQANPGPLAALVARNA